MPIKDALRDFALFESLGRDNGARAAAARLLACDGSGLLLPRLTFPQGGQHGVCGCSWVCFHVWARTQGHRPLGTWGQMWLCWWWLCSAPAPSHSPHRVRLALTTGPLLLAGHTGRIPASAGCLLAAPASSPCSFRVSRRRCCDLPPDTFWKGSRSAPPGANLCFQHSASASGEALCWCPTPMQSLGVAGAWINHALERRQLCLHKSRSGLQMLPPCEIPGGVACKGGWGV